MQVTARRCSSLPACDLLHARGIGFTVALEKRRLLIALASRFPKIMLLWTHVRWLVLLIVALLLHAPPLFATPPSADSTGTIRGVVQTAEAGAPLPGANVAVRTVEDSTLVGGTAADSSGRFVIRDVPFSAYRVVASMVGYAPASRQVELTAAQPIRTLDAFHLTRSTAQMEGVEVAADRSFVTTAGSKTVYDMEQAEIALGGKSVADVLRDLPSIRIELDGGILLRGNANVAIHINGEPAPMDGQALVQYLESLSGEDIERVEVDTNPSARHDAEGTAGIINIVLGRRDRAGWYGSVTVSGGTGPRANGSGNLGYEQGPWMLHGSYSYRRVGQELRQHLLRHSRGDASATLLDQRAVEDRTFGGHSFSAEVEYALTPDTKLSLTSMGSTRGIDETRTVRYRADEAGQVAVAPDREGAEDRRYLQLDERLGVTHQFGEEEHELSAQARYQARRQRQTFRDRVTRPPVPRERGQNEEVEHAPTVTMDYTRPLGPWTVETGYKGSFRHLSQAYDRARFDEVRDRFEPLLERQRAFTFTEQVHAGYGIFQRTVGSFDVEAGLRMEHAQTAVDSDAAASDANRYADVYPSASLTYNATRGRQLALSYSKRVNRPSFHQLSSFGLLSNSHLRFEGNPDLEPEQVHKIELTWMERTGPATVTLSPYARHRMNTIDWITTVHGDSLTVRSFDNYDASTSFGVELSTSLRVGRAVQAHLSGNAYRMRTRGQNLGSDVTRDAFAVSGRASATWRVRPGLQMQLSQFYRSPVNAGLGRMDAFSRSEVAVEQSFWNDRATLSVRVRDPFDSSNMGFRKRNPDFVERMNNDWTGRTLSVSFSYRFGDADEKHRSGQPSSGQGGMMPLGDG